MAAPLYTRPLAFAVPAVGRTAILPQTVTLGTIVKIKHVNADYFNVSCRSVPGPDNPLSTRTIVVRRVVEDDGVHPVGGYVVERAGFSGMTSRVLGYFRSVHLRAALGSAAVNVAADWIAEVRNGGLA